MSYPAGYDPSPLAPIIQIYSPKWRLKYTWEHPILNENPTQDAPLLSWRLSVGINTDAGSASIEIEDNGNNLTDGTSRSGPIFKTGDILQILLGKSSETLATWFTGIVNEPQLNRPGNAQQTITVPAYGWANRLNTRYITLIHRQIQNADDTFDDNDDSAKISNLVNRIMTDESILLLPPPDRSLTYAIDDIDIKIATLTKKVQTQQIALAELANIANAVYGITPDLQFYFRDSRQSSGATATNNLMTQADTSKLMILRNQSYDYRDSAVRKAFTSLIGDGITQVQNLAEYIGTSYITSDGNDEDWIAFELPWLGKIDNIDLWLGHTGSGGYDMPWKIVHETDNQLSGTEAAIASGVIPRETVESWAPGGEWVRFNLTHDPLEEQYYRAIMFGPDDPDSTRSKNWSRARIYFDSSGNWHRWRILNHRTETSPTAGVIACRIRGEQVITLKAQNTTIKHKQLPKENLQSLSNVESTATGTALYEGILQQAGNVRRNYANMIVSAPASRPELGKTFRLIDTHQKLNTSLLLIGYDVQSNKDNQLTALDITLEAEEWF